MRLELLLLDWFFNEEEEAVCTSFLSGPVEVLVVMRTIIYEITHKCGLHVIFNDMPTVMVVMVVMAMVTLNEMPQHFPPCSLALPLDSDSPRSQKTWSV